MKPSSSLAPLKLADLQAFAANVSSIANTVFGGRPSRTSSGQKSDVTQEEVIKYFQRYKPDELALVTTENPIWAAAEVLEIPRAKLESDSEIWDRYRKWRSRVTENQVALVVCQIASSQENGIATFARLKRDVPKYLKLSSADRVKSITRPNEEMWEQLIRNIKSHSKVPGNFIHEGYLLHIPRTGYQVTKSGRRLALEGKT